MKEFKPYDIREYNKLLAKKPEELTEDEKDYIKYCYHYEEWQAGLL
jgi:hypothetical protein